MLSQYSKYTTGHHKLMLSHKQCIQIVQASRVWELAQSQRLPTTPDNYVATIKLPASLDVAVQAVGEEQSAVNVLCTADDGENLPRKHESGVLR